MFKNLQIYRTSTPIGFFDHLEPILSAKPLTACSGAQHQSRGWVLPSPGTAFAAAQGPHALIALGTEKRLLPGPVVKQEVAKRAVALERVQGYPAGRKQLRDLKDQVITEFLKSAFTVLSQTVAWLNRDLGYIVVDAGSSKKAEDLLSRLRTDIGDAGLALAGENILDAEPPHTRVPPSNLMTAWLRNGELPGSNFVLDADCVLQRGGVSGGPKVTYAAHDLHRQDIRAHIAEGKEVTKLAMTWRDQLSFVVNGDLQISKFKFLAIEEKEAPQQPEDESTMFDAALALMSGTLDRFLPELMALFDAIPPER